MLIRPDFPIENCTPSIVHSLPSTSAPKNRLKADSPRITVRAPALAPCGIAPASHALLTAPPRRLQTGPGRLSNTADRGPQAPHLYHFPLSPPLSSQRSVS